MDNIPLIVVKRLQTSIPKFKKILERSLERDVNESDTVTIVIGMLSGSIGFKLPPPLL